MTFATFFLLSSRLLRPQSRHTLRVSVPVSKIRVSRALEPYKSSHPFAARPYSFDAVAMSTTLDPILETGHGRKNRDYPVSHQWRHCAVKLVSHPIRCNFDDSRESHERAVNQSYTLQTKTTPCPKRHPVACRYRCKRSRHRQ